MMAATAKNDDFPFFASMVVVIVIFALVAIVVLVLGFRLGLCFRFSFVDLA